MQKAVENISKYLILIILFFSCKSVKIDEKEIYSYITEGIGEDIIPENIDFSIIDRFIKVTDKDGALLTRDLAKMEGLFVSIL